MIVFNLLMHKFSLKTCRVYTANKKRRLSGITVLIYSGDYSFSKGLYLV